MTTVAHIIGSVIAVGFWALVVVGLVALNARESRARRRSIPINKKRPSRDQVGRGA